MYHRIIKKNCTEILPKQEKWLYRGNKESDSADAVFVDLFANRNNNFSEWDVEMQAGDWKTYFSSLPIEAVKHNKVSVLFRNEGDECIKRGEWLEAIELYTQSVRFAEVGTELVCIAYASKIFVINSRNNYFQWIESML